MLNVQLDYQIIPPHLWSCILFVLVTGLFEVKVEHMRGFFAENHKLAVLYK